MEENVNSLASTAFTRVKNHYEANRSNIVKSRSEEYQIACCCHCKDATPDIYKENNQELAWSQKNYAFLENEYNPMDNDANGHLCVHPNLWENGASNHLSGVFEVLKDKIYQVRGYDMSNLTFVRSNPPKKDSTDNESPRWIVFDTLMSNECTKAAMDLFENFLQNDLLKSTHPNYALCGSIVGMIISHSHIDHYGGMETVEKYFVKDGGNGKFIENVQKSEDNVKKVANRFILAPAGFYDHAVSENVYLGNAMGRRASYQYGSFIKPKNANDVSGEISIGIGQGQSTGTPSAVGRPTMEITEENTTHSIMLDEIEVEFQLTPGTEAPAEMNNYIPCYKALWLAENCSGTLHNLYTLRGAEIRDAKAWSHFLMETAHLYGDEKKTEVIFQSHNWPHWGENTTENDGKKTVPTVNIRNFIIETAAIYKYIHDQTLLYMNMGYKMNEVADMLVLPRGMQKNWTLKPFYGTPVHNAKAVYQKYLGWYDANPIHLQELPPEQLAKETLRYVMAGSREKMLSMIDEDIAKGNYWTAAYMAHQMVLAGENSDDIDDAKKLCATALRQLGYQSESGTWRNAYLSAAYELTHDKARSTQDNKSDQLAQMPPETLLDYISIFFDGERAASKIDYDICLDVQNTDEKQRIINQTYFVFVVKNGAILYYEITEKDYNEQTREKIVVDFKELKSVAMGSYKKNGSCQDNDAQVKCKFLSDISNAVIVVSNKDRFKYFDIIGRHDSNVQNENGDIVDLKTEVLGCINLLEKYVRKFENEKSVLVLSNEDNESWNNYYNLLKIQTLVTLDGDFFIPGDETMGIGNDGKFMPYELYYTLYTLYRYLYRSYLKNDFGYKGTDDSFTKLKQSIVLLETYVADYYLCDSNYSVEFDLGDSLAWRYLNNVSDESSTLVSFNVADFFKELYTRYKKLPENIRY